jgi:hypothetical protein
MANKYHKRQGFRVGKVVKKIATPKTLSAKEAFENIYKLDKTGAKDRILASINRRLKEEKKYTKDVEEPSMLEDYTDMMVTDFSQKKGPFIEKRKIRDERNRIKNLEKKLKKDKNK